MDKEKKPNDQVLLDNIGKIAYTLDRAYMSRLSKDYGVLYFDEKYNVNSDISYTSNIRAVQVDKWLFDKEQEPGECFKNVLSTFADGDHTIALVVRRYTTKTEMYFVVKNDGKGRNEESRDNAELLDAAIHGNFPGTHTRIIKDEEEITRLFSNNEKIVVDGNKVDLVNSVSLFANTPSEYSEKYITQGLDKLLNGIVPANEKEAYTIVFMAESISQAAVREILSGYEDIASAINPFAQYQFQVGSNQVETNGEMSSISHGMSTTNSVFKTHSINVGVDGSMSSGYSKSKTSDKREAAKAILGTGGAIIGGIAGGAAGFFVGGPAGVAAGAPAGAKLGNKVGNVVGSMKKVVTETQTNEKSLGGSLGYGYSWGTSKAITNATTNTEGKSHSISVGESENTTYTYKSFMVTNLLERLQKTMERINESQATGLWKYSTYVLAYDSKTSKSVANYLKGITQGKESYIEPSIIQEWSKVEGNASCPFNEIKKYVSLFCHPVFVTVGEQNDDAMLVTPTSYVGTEELSNVIAFPKKSLQGIPIVEGVAFGREPYSLTEISKDIEMGNAYHLHEVIEKQKIDISMDELSKHTFIAGTTGSGKSNTIYWMLEKLVEKEKKFMVIEPAKGEYKLAVGQNGNVFTYGTNPLHNDSILLKINPFSFPTETHILEHLDRLVEIFNVCWPMYAAMPAILKDSIERAYIAAGWDILKSTNRYDERLFPTFSDVMIQIKQVLNESDYSNDNKGDYIGSLVTRIKSLTNGINGLIFSSDEIQPEKLFDRNVIIDLSRVGSTETKSLIMGLLILKLQEYRMQCNKSDTPLTHVTVIEEAHNLLKRTSTEQSSETSNLLGKSVELLANSIAEMRTYGEGFILADQSPSLLDMSVIRNTNTKIIMRLPDYEDRKLVGKAAGLTDVQIDELSKLEMGVASITQSGWIEPVLCKMHNYKEDAELLKGSQNIKIYDDSKGNVSNEADRFLIDLIMKREIYRKCDRTDIDTLKKKIISSDLDATVKCEFLDYITDNEENSLENLRKLVYDMFGASDAIEKNKDLTSDLYEWAKGVAENLSPSICKYSVKSVNLVLSLIIYEQARRDVNYKRILFKFTEEYMMKGRVV